MEINAPSQLSPGPNDYEVLKQLRSTYALVYIFVLVISWCLSGYLQAVAASGQPQSGAGAPDLSTLWPLLLVPTVLGAGVTGFFAHKVGMRFPLLPALFALFPVIGWIGFFMVIGYLPEDLKEYEPPEEQPPVAIWLIIGMLPLACMGMLTALRPSYMGQLFVGPPVGAYIPGMAIPCGWPIIALIILAIVLTDLPLYLGFHRRLVRGWWKALLIILVVAHFVFPAIYLSVLGPAAIQLFKTFSSG
jgi:hypothetical protein